MGDRGNHREMIIRDFLRPFLPDCYGLSTGEVFSTDGTQSAQVDVVIYDAVFSAVLFKAGPHQLCPAAMRLAIVIDPELLNGTPCFRGSRVPFKNLAIT